MKRTFVAWLLAALLILPSCGGKTPAADGPESGVSVSEPVTLALLSLELCAPARGGAGFPAAAKDFAAALQTALAGQGVTVETVDLSFSRADAATAQALAEGGVALGVLSPLAALREDAVLPLSFMARDGGEPSFGMIAATGSAYGAQLAQRAAGNSPISWTEWNRAVFGAVESDVLLRAAADFAFTESTEHGLGQLGSWRSFSSEKELLAAAECGKVDAVLIRRESGAQYPALLETGALYDAVFAVSPAAEELMAEPVRAALQSALAETVETDAGLRFLQQYGCGDWIAAEKEEIETLARLAKWEDIQ